MGARRPPSPGGQTQRCAPRCSEPPIPVWPRGWERAACPLPPPRPHIGPDPAPGGALLGVLGRGVMPRVGGGSGGGMQRVLTCCQ